MDYRDNPQHRALLQAWLPDFYAATVVYFCSGEWYVFAPALTHYNNERTHQGKICEGRTPMQTLEDGKRIWREKFVDQT